MSKTYLPYEPDQQLLLPAALQEWPPGDGRQRGCLTTIWPTSYRTWWTSWTCRRSPLATSGNGVAGRRIIHGCWSRCDDHLAYFISDVVDQLDMSKVLYGYCVGVSSSRRIAQRLHEDIAFRVLAANNTPDFRTISDFRKDNLDALSGLFIQVLALCQQAGLVKLGHGQGQRIEA